MGQTHSTPVPFVNTTVDVTPTNHAASVREMSPQACCGGPFFTNRFSFFGQPFMDFIVDDNNYGDVPQKRIIPDEKILLHSCRRVEWCNAMHLHQQHFLQQLEQEIQAVNENLATDRFRTYITLCLLYEHILKIKEQNEKEVPYLREWVTFFISPLISLDLIMDAVQPGFSTAIFQNRSNIEESYEDFVQIAEWVHRVFPFISITAVYKELEFLADCIRAGSSNYLNTNVFELFFKKQLASCLENELEIAKKISNSIKILNALVNQNLLQCKAYIQYSYISIMSEKLFMKKSDAIYLDDHILALIFHRSLSDPGLSSYILLVSKKIANKKFILDFLRHYPLSHKAIYPPCSTKKKRFKTKAEFPPPPLPPFPGSDQDQHITLKMVEAFLKRCCIDFCFLDYIVSRYNDDHCSDISLKIDSHFPSWLAITSVMVNMSTPSQANFMKRSSSEHLLLNNKFFPQTRSLTCIASLPNKQVTPIRHVKPLNALDSSTI